MRPQQNNKNQRTNNKKPYEKFNPITATALFLDFKTAIQAARQYCKAVDKYFEGIDEDANYDDYVAYVATRAALNYPQVLSKSNIHTSYNISSRSVRVREENGIAFGWNISYDVDDGQATITAVTFTITMYRPIEELKDALDSHGWELTQKESKKQ